jgi:hypothetical protein
MIGLLKFVFNANFIIGAILGGLVGKFVVPHIWKPKEK